MPDDLLRGVLPISEHTAHEAEMDRLRQERDERLAWLAAQDPVPHGAMTQESLGHKRKWWKVQRMRATQQRRRRGTETGP